ncbi:hypothetical protein BS17DRAFT_765125 [Gyrodon lividus]|nr:hypothetical protein BS17DRAFT_765125 [Gyrodon lividus]
MVECANCLKHFKDSSGVTWHLSQHLTSCHHWKDDLILVTELLDHHKKQEIEVASPIPHLPVEQVDSPANDQSEARHNSDVEMDDGTPTLDGDVLMSMDDWNPPVPLSNTMHFKDCIEILLNHTSQCVYETAEHVIHLYSEWMMGNAAWNMYAVYFFHLQLQLPPGASLLGVTPSLDKTNITNMTGSCVVHPLLLSLANIQM